MLLGYSELLLEKIPQLSINEIEKFVREIKDTTESTFTLLEDLLKWASLRQINNEVIIIVETADKLSEVTEEFAGVKINDYLPKPYNKPYLNQLIIKHFNKKNKNN